jgi:hypothetical protein
MQPLTDNQLHELAKKRVEFRTHLVVYLVINGMLWFIWYITGSTYPWPVWPMMGWGIGLIFHYIFDYRRHRLFSEDEEFERLKKEFNRK